MKDISTVESSKALKDYVYAHRIWVTIMVTQYTGCQIGLKSKTGPFDHYVHYVNVAAICVCVVQPQFQKLEVMHKKAGLRPLNKEVNVGVWQSNMCLGRRDVYVTFGGGQCKHVFLCVTDFIRFSVSKNES